MTSDWIIESWSRERGRGSVRAPRFGSLSFDGSVGEIGGFIVGESVLVTLEPSGSSFRVMRVAPVQPSLNAGQPSPYDLPIWRSSHAAVSPSGTRSAEIARASEYSMGTPSLGCLRTSDGLVLQRCNPSFLWSDCSRYLAVPQLESFMGILFGMRMVVIDCERRLIGSSKRYRGWLQPESFHAGVLGAVLHPSSSARRLSWQVPAGLSGFKARPYPARA